MSTKKGREVELDLVRVISMLMIVFCHISAEVGMKWGEYFNVGVIIFLFMSGNLAYKKEYDGDWIIGRLRRLLPEYYIFIALYLIVTIGFFHEKYSPTEILVNLFLLQGLFTENGLPNILHLWFITYILICYLLTPWLVRLMSKSSRNKLIAIIVALQITVLPLRIIGIKIVFSRFIAYFAGLYSAMLSDEWKTNKISEYRSKIKKLSIPVIIISVVRFLCESPGVRDRLPGVINLGFGLLWQWAHMLLGIYLFFLLWIFCHAALSYINDNKKKSILRISEASYCVYIVHQVFVYHEYAITRYVKPFILGIIVALILIAISAWLLLNLSNAVRTLLKNI